MNCVDRADGSRGRLTSCSAFLGKVVQQFIQRLVSGIVGGPIGAIAIAGNLDAHGLPAALDLPTKWICTIAAAADDDKISSVSIIGMHTVSTTSAEAVGSRSAVSVNSTQLSIAVRLTHGRPNFSRPPARYHLISSNHFIAS